MKSKNETKITGESGKQDIIITREFEAPRELVFKAYTDPDLLKQWLGPRGYEMHIDKFDARSGGEYRYIHTGKNGEEYSFRGVFHDISAPESAVQTFEFEGAKGHVSLDTAMFEVLPGNRTRVTTTSVFQSVADRDMMLRSNMENGVTEGYQRLDELIEKRSLKQEIFSVRNNTVYVEVVSVKQKQPMFFYYFRK
ncbi:SRPBCC family protein [Emticicia sp. BO119]|uniref:SRPBCC family protein n=1 Tax=Emticicia sp. BO119 TaxID=2757768 RepID=UPI0015F10F3F|nr:SRPBCC family protein [Emticicia sp. BO119]MBA4852896.1 SRPBCC family protein [Emticicia sp. BO119]